jgi:hypothetical protein
MAAALRSGAGGRDTLFLSQGAWSLQRSARWDRWVLIHTINTGIKDFSEWMLFNLEEDPHETVNLAASHPDIVQAVGSQMTGAFARMSQHCSLGDPFEQVQAEGGPFHARATGSEWGPYLERLRATGRSHHADWLHVNGNLPRPADLAAY